MHDAMVLAAFRALAFLFVILAPFANVYASPAPLPLVPREIVRTYLENDAGRALMRKHLDLHPDGIYNPLLYFSRDYVPEQITHEKYRTRSL